MFLPGGTAISHNASALTHNQKIFGDDVDTFRPERYLECEESERRAMERANDILFGGGRWMCLGKTVALTELSKLAFEVRHNVTCPCLEDTCVS